MYFSLDILYVLSFLMKTEVKVNIVFLHDKQNNN